MKQYIFTWLRNIFKKKSFKAFFLRINNNKTRRVCYIPLILFLLCPSCISFDLSTLKDHIAQGVIFQAPPAPYKKTAEKGMDAVWKNPEDGSVLSFFSNCSSATPFSSLDQFQKDLLEELKSFRLIYKKESHHQEQKALYLKLNRLNKKSLNKQSKTMMDLFLFKKEKCFYTLSFLISGEPQTRPAPVFKSFIQEFRAP